MALPKLASTKYELTLPSTGEKVEYRPFLVKEEKVLLTAQQAGTEQDQLRAVKEIVESCTFGVLKANELPFFDIEYVFLQLRAKSVGETSKLKVTCPDDGETKVEIEVNLTEVECKRDVTHNDNIKITDDIGIIMDYPRLETMSVGGSDETKQAFDIIKGSIKQIYDADNVYDKNQMNDKELDEFIESMSHEQFEKVQEFFTTMPRVRHSVKIKNPNTGIESEIMLEGMASFF